MTSFPALRPSGSQIRKEGLPILLAVVLKLNHRHNHVPAFGQSTLRLLQSSQTDLDFLAFGTPVLAMFTRQLMLGRLGARHTKNDECRDWEEDEE